MSSNIATAVAVDIRRTEVQSFAKPELPTDGGLLRVEKTGVCGSDWPFYLSMPKTRGPLILGHVLVAFIGHDNVRVGIDDHGHGVSIKTGAGISFYLFWHGHERPWKAAWDRVR